MTEDIQTIVVLASMFFSAKIKGAVEHAGYAYSGVIGESGLLKQLDQRTPLCVFLDLSKEDIDFASLIQTLRSNQHFVSIPIVAFCGHVETAKLKAAQEWGCDVVTTNGSIVSGFTKILEEAINRTRIRCTTQ